MAFIITTAIAEAVSQRFWAKVLKNPGPCWEWGAGKDWDGYGHIKYSSHGSKRTLLAHRVSYVLHHGEIPDGMVVRHTCDNPSCVNHDHLLLGTVLDNNQDKVQRGRMADQRGERNPANRLDDETVRRIIAVLAEPNPPRQRDIAERFGCSQMTVSLIRQGKTWNHIQRPEALRNACPGPRSGKVRLTDETVRLVRRLLAEGVPQVHVGRAVGLSQCSISAIALGKSYAHVS